MELKSPAFQQGKPIPKKYTCQGEDISPPLVIGGLPSGTKSIALIVEDPDAPHGTFDHWIGWNLDPAQINLEEGKAFPSEGKNGFGDTRYRGPCPPPGTPHRYYFKLYALDGKIDLPQGSTKQQLEDAIKSHIIGHAELMGTYKR